MPIVTFWSDGKGAVGKTTALAGIATLMGVEKKYKILIVNTKKNDITIEDCFWNTVGVNERLSFKEKDKRDMESGIKGLVKAVMSNRTAPEVVTNYTKVVFTGHRLEVLTSRISKETDKETEETKNLTEEQKEELRETEYQNQRKMLKNILRMADKFYDLVFVDVDGELDDPIISEILDLSNVLVPVVSQGLRNIENHKQMMGETTLFNGGNVINIIGRYDKHSKYTEKNLAKHIGVKKMYGVPYNTQFFEACHEGQLADYLIKFRKQSPTDQNGPLIHGVRRIYTDLVELLQMLQMSV